MPWTTPVQGARGITEQLSELKCVSLQQTRKKFLNFDFIQIALEASLLKWAEVFVNSLLIVFGYITMSLNSVCFSFYFLKLLTLIEINRSTYSINKHTLTNVRYFWNLLSQYN